MTAMHAEVDERRPSASNESGLWLDRPDAFEVLEAMTLPERTHRALAGLIRDGLAILPGAVEPDLCQNVIDDYARYSAEHRSYVDSNRDVLGREKRLVNFHLWSDAAMRVGTNAETLGVLDKAFERTACVYTSLTFKYGTQQPVHRDTPHFATWPRGMFVGVWTALEDVTDESGPLFYHPGAHRFGVDRRALAQAASEALGEAPPHERHLHALDLYNGEIIRRSPEVSPPVPIRMKRGDTVIWHPELPHGGLPAADQHRTRWSTVFHCAPVDVQVHQHQAFFSHFGDAAPAARYGYLEAYGRKVARAGEVSFM